MQIDDQRPLATGASHALVEAHALASEQRRAAEELLEHARALEAQIESELAHSRTGEAASRVDPDGAGGLRAALEEARRDLRDMERHLADAARAFERVEEGCRNVDRMRGITHEAELRIAARRAADDARRAAHAERRP